MKNLSKLKVGKNGYLLGQVQCQVLYQFTQHKIMKGTHTQYVAVNHEHYTSCTVQEHLLITFPYTRLQLTQTHGITGVH